MVTSTTSRPASIEPPDAPRGRPAAQRRPAAAALLFFSAACSASLLVARQARAADAKEKDQCIGAADQAQQLRDDSKYLQAREAFARCARDTCPAVVRQDCTQWLQDLDERTPTAVFAAHDDKGVDLTNVFVSIDGVPFPTTIDGKPVALDPGDHALHFEAPGYTPVDTHVVIRTGEKNRVIGVQFQSRQAPPLFPPPTTSPLPDAGLRPHSHRPPLVAWVLGGVAVASFASEAYFGVTGLVERNHDLSPGGCAPHCAEGEKSWIQSRFTIADVSLGTGLLSAGLAAYFFLSAHGADAPPATTAVDVRPGPGGGVATFALHF